MQINDVYEELKANKLCRSGRDFSSNYLGKHKSYLSMINARDERPSIEAWAMLNYTLQSRAQVFASSDNEFVLAAAARLQALQQAVAANVMMECAARNR
jgi:hypothetical protein